MPPPRSPMRAPLPPRPAGLPEPSILRTVREALIGADTCLPGPFGVRRIVYADYTASGRSLGFIEDYIRDHVLPLYANTHTEASSTGRHTTQLREQARAMIHRHLGADDDTVVIFAGSGSTGAIDKLIGCLNIRLPADLDATYGLSSQIPVHERPVVFIGPYEHHSNELPWRESIADVVVIPEDGDGHIDLSALTDALHRYRDRPLKIGSFSAASNVTGILTDIDAVSVLLHSHGALSFWDYAAAAPYVAIRMAPPSPDSPAYSDAVFFSPHKFVGGPGTPGVLAVRTEVLHNSVPAVVGGGTVAFVNPSEHRYVSDPVHREEAGTPAIVESIRAGLVVALKDRVGHDVITSHERDFVTRAIAAWSQHPRIEVLGNRDVERLSIVSFVVSSPTGRQLHHNFVVAVLNDLFGIQSRGGCSCAGPYGHRLLGIDLETSHEFAEQISTGCEGIKPGWVRVNFNYFLSEDEFAFLVDAVWLVAEYGCVLLPEYTFDPVTGRWRHRDGPVGAGALLWDLSGVATGTPPVPPIPAFEAGSLADTLAAAEEVLIGRSRAEGFTPPDRLDRAALTAGFEKLRWFDIAGPTGR